MRVANSNLKPEELEALRAYYKGEHIPTLVKEREHEYAILGTGYGLVVVPTDKASRFVRRGDRDTLGSFDGEEAFIYKNYLIIKRM